MGLFNSHYLSNENSIPLNHVTCNKIATDIMPVYFNTRSEFKEFFIPSFARKGIVRQCFEVIPDNSSAFIIQGIDDPISSKSAIAVVDPSSI